MRRFLVLALVMLTACGGSTAITTTDATTTSTTTTAPTATTATTLAPDPWVQDLNALVTALEETHANPYWRVGEDAFKADVAEVATRIADLPEDQATLELVRLTALIDGHTQIFVGFLNWDFARIQFYGFDDGIGVVGSDDPELIGGRLIAVGGTPAAEAHDRTAVLAAYDNPMTKRFTTPFLMAVPRVNAALGITDDPEAITYTIERVDGTIVEVTPELGDFEDYREWFGDPVIGLPLSDRAPYLARRTTPFWWTTLDDGTIYLQYNEVASNGTDPLTGDPIRLLVIADEIDAALEASPGARLVVDLRHNGGGDNNTYGGMLTMLTERYADSCGLFVLIGRATFSAATNFATEVEQDTDAVFIGEPTGGSPNLFGNARTVTLPNTGIGVRIASTYHEYGGPDDHRVWIEPEIPVPPTLADWFAGRDAALEAALAATPCQPVG